jgi:hypothetical protein
MSLRREAEATLGAEMERAPGDDEYPFDVYLTHMLGWVRAWVTDFDLRKRELESLLVMADDVCSRMPRNRRIRGVRDALFQEYLGLGVVRTD